MQPPSLQPRIYETGGWKAHEWAEASSTNDLARSLPPWSIALCEVQTSGRGRFNRPWIGAKGGLWSSFTVPLDSGNPDVNWGHLPLVAGLALLDILSACGIANARLRWPNDLMIGECKLAGILVERPSENMAVIGIGINVCNDMDALAGKTKDCATSMARHLSDCPSLPSVLERLARQIRSRFNQFSDGGLASIFDDLKLAWKEQKAVTVDTDDKLYAGIFCGIDMNGNPVIQDENGRQTAIPSHLVNRLAEN